MNVACETMATRRAEIAADNQIQRARRPPSTPAIWRGETAVKRTPVELDRPPTRLAAPRSDRVMPRRPDVEGADAEPVDGDRDTADDCPVAVDRGWVAAATAALSS